MRHLKPGKTRPSGPAVRRSRNPASNSLTAAAPIRKHPRPKLATHAKAAGNTNKPRERPRRAGSTSGNLPRNRDRGPRNSAGAGTAASLPSLAKRDAPPALRPTGSPAGTATPGGGPRPDKRQRRTKQTSERRTGYNPHRDDHQLPRRLPPSPRRQPILAGGCPSTHSGRGTASTPGQVRGLCPGAEDESCEHRRPAGD